MPLKGAGARVRAEQRAAGLQRCVKLPQYARQFLAGHMGQRGICEHAVEVARRQIQLEKTLLQNLAATERTLIVANCADPSSPVTRCPSRLNVSRSRPGPQPKSNIANGGAVSMDCNSAAMF